MSNSQESTQGLMTMSEHLAVLRRLFARVLLIVFCLTILVFIFKEQTFSIVLAPRDSDFVFYKWTERLLQCLGIDFHFKSFNVEMISTDLSSQFMLHISTSLYVALLLASPYIVFELFRYLSPALYDKEKKYSVPIAFTVYILFSIGIFITYYILFPFSFRFLGTYQVDSSIKNTITLTSYISTLVSMSLVMGIVFQLPVLSYILGKLGVLSYEILAQYRKWAIMIILTLSAVITPPDIFTLLLVAGPLYSLYEVSILVLKKIKQHSSIV